MVALHIHEPTFNSYLTDDYQLRLSIGTDGVAYIVTDAQHDVLVWEAHPWEARMPVAQLHKRVQALVRQDAVLQSSFAQTTVIINFPQTVLVPTDWFEAWETDTYLTQTIGDEGVEEVSRTDVFAPYAVQLAYTLPQSLLYALGTCFPKVQVQHSHTHILRAAQYMATRKQQLCVYVMVRTGSLTVAVVDAERLYLLNTYSYQTTKDFLYFILLVFQQLQLSQNTTPLILAGELLPESEIFTTLATYIKHIDWAERPPDCKIGTVAQAQIAPHFWNDLLFCEQ
jgi:hypothetical protein